jgi:hypothetical protein
VPAEIVGEKLGCDKFNKIYTLGNLNNYNGTGV